MQRRMITLLPTVKQRKKIASWSLPVPRMREEATNLLSFILEEGPAGEVGSRVEEVRKVAHLVGKDVVVTDSTYHYGVAVRLRVRSPEERGHIAQECGGHVPSIYAVIVRDKDGIEHEASISHVRLTRAARCSDNQKRLFT